MNRPTVAFGGIAGGDFSGDPNEGTYTIFPTKGDCVSAPVTEVIVELRFVLKQ